MAGSPRYAPAPADNPTTAAKVELGKMLYFDPRLSSTGTVSCFSCHNVMEGGDDHMTTSAGVHGLKGGRNAPTVWNAAFHSVQFWDGRAPSLEEQAKGPPVNPIEMGMPNLDAVIGRITHASGLQTLLREGVRHRYVCSWTTQRGDRRVRTHAVSRPRAVLTTVREKATRRPDGAAGEGH